MQDLTNPAVTFDTWCWIALAAVAVGGLLAAGLLRRRRLASLHQHARQLYRELAYPRQGVDPTEMAEDYDAVCFAYNVVREMPLSKVVARSWPMLAWSPRVLREAQMQRGHYQSAPEADLPGAERIAPVAWQAAWPERGLDAGGRSADPRGVL